MTNVATDTNAAVTKATTTDLPMVYVNGQMLPKSQAAVNVFDHGLLYGDGVFEGIRVYKGKIFKSAQHMRRLYACAKAIRLDLEKHVTPDEMVKIQRDCIEANGLVDKYAYITNNIVNWGLRPRDSHAQRSPPPQLGALARAARRLEDP